MSQSPSGATPTVDKTKRGPAGDGYRVERFDASESVTADDVLALWKREGQIPDDEAQRRLAEVLMVGVHETGELAAVSTAYLRRNKQLRMDMWHYRALTSADHRSGNLANAMFTEAVAHLSDRFAAGADRRGAGLILEIQNPELRRQFTEAGTTFPFIGEDELGAHVRVLYFDGASVPVPAI